MDNEKCAVCKEIHPRGLYKQYVAKKISVGVCEDCMRREWRKNLHYDNHQEQFKQQKARLNDE